jgi:hypothetical protein
MFLRSNDLTSDEMDVSSCFRTEKSALTCAVIDGDKGIESFLDDTDAESWDCAPVREFALSGGVPCSLPPSVRSDGHRETCDGEGMAAASPLQRGTPFQKSTPTMSESPKCWLRRGFGGHAGGPKRARKGWGVDSGADPSLPLLLVLTNSEVIEENGERRRRSAPAVSTDGDRRKSSMLDSMLAPRLDSASCTVRK